MKALPTVILFTLILFSIAAGAATIHVPGDQPTIQAGINAASSHDTVLIADGVYTGDGNRNLDFGGKDITVASQDGPQNCIIDCEDTARGFYFHSSESHEAMVRGLTIRNGNPDGGGGGIRIVDCSPTIKGNWILDNQVNPTWQYHGGGISVSGANAQPRILDNRFNLNHADFGGGLYAGDGSAPTITNNLFTNNVAEEAGGGLCCLSDGTSISINNTFWQNQSGEAGGGIYCNNLYMTSTIVWDNTAVVYGGDIYLRNYNNPTFSLDYSAIGPDTYAEDGMVVVSGEGNIYDNPLFVSGPEGSTYLSQTAAGQASDSPCVNAGDPLADLIYGTTRTDQVLDGGVTDMGYHFPGPTGGPRLVTGPGPGYDNAPLVRVMAPVSGGPVEWEFSAYGSPHYGTNVTCGDINGDGIDEILTGAGPGDIYGPHVRGFNISGGEVPGLSYLAYGTNKFGVNVATGDLTGDGIDEIITGAGPGAVFGPHVRGWTYDGPSGITAIPGVSYFAYGTPKWGVNVAAGDIDGDGFDEIVTGAGPGAVYGPHVRGWNVDGGAVAGISEVSFLAYGTNKFGVNVSTGDVDGDGIDEIVTGAGPGAVFGPHVRGWNYDGGTVTPLPGFSFFAWDTEPLSFGANVFAGADLNADGRAELVVGRGPNPTADTAVKVFTYNGSEISQWLALETYSGLTYGTNVAAGQF